MKASISGAALAVSALLFALPAYAQSAAEPSPTVALKAITYVGCYSDSQPLEDQGSYTFQSPGYCQKVCAALNKPVMATQKGSNCWCGNKLPSTDAKTSESDCNSHCDGFGQDMCRFSHSQVLQTYLHVYRWRTKCLVRIAGWTFG
jgi:cell wall integrity and stress response component